MPPPAFLDALLEAAAHLAGETDSSPATAGGASASSSSTPAATPPEVATADGATNGANPDRPAAPEAASRTGEPPAAPAESSADAILDGGTDRERPNRPFTIALAVGGGAASLSGGGLGTIGPAAGVHASGSVLGPLVLGITGELRFSPGKVDALAPRVAELALRADWLLDARRRWLAGAAVGGGWFAATADNSLTPEHRQANLIFVGLRAGYIVRWSPVSLLIAPELRAYPQPVSVAIGGVERFGTGRFGAGLVIAAWIPIFGSAVAP